MTYKQAKFAIAFVSMMFASTLSRAEPLADCTQVFVDADRAIRGCTTVIDIIERHPKSVDASLAAAYVAAYVHRGVAYHRKGDHNRALADLTKAIALKPGNDLAVDAYYARGITYENLSKKDLAIADYRKALSLDPNHTGSAEQLKKLGLSNVSSSDALSDCKQTLDPDRTIRGCSIMIGSGTVFDLFEENAQFPAAVVYNNRGFAYDDKGDYDRAIADYTKAIALDPKYAMAYNNRAASYENKGDHDRAIADAAKAIALDPKMFHAYHNRGNAYYNRGTPDNGDYPRAIADYTKVIALDPSYVNAYYGRGLTYKEMGDKVRAIADFRKALSLDPSHPQSVEQLKKLGSWP